MADQEFLAAQARVEQRTKELRKIDSEIRSAEDLQDMIARFEVQKSSGTKDQRERIEHCKAQINAQRDIIIAAEEAIERAQNKWDTIVPYQAEIDAQVAKMQLENRLAEYQTCLDKKNGEYQVEIHNYAGQMVSIMDLKAKKMELEREQANDNRKLPVRLLRENHICKRSESYFAYRMQRQMDGLCVAASSESFKIVSIMANASTQWLR
jgi:hypothetical protein